MKLSTDSWHYRNYEAWREHARSRPHGSVRHVYSQPNLCTYMRIALIWGPLRRFLNLFDRFSEEFRILLGLFLLVYVFSVGFILLLGSSLSLWHTFLIIPAACFFIIIGSCTASVKLIELFEGISRRRGAKAKTRVVKEYIKAKKQRVCPIIEFEEQS